MAKPRFSSCPPEEQKRQRDDYPSVNPGEQSPLRIRNFKKTNRKQQKQRNNRDCRSD
jgi:hypothetical protein